MLRKFLAIVVLPALLLAGVPALADSLAAPDMASCCTTAYCPLHHRQARDLQRDKSNCDAHGHSAGEECSLRACDAPPNPAMGTALYVLAAPMSIGFRLVAEPAPGLVSLFFPVALNLPSTPPPRTLPS